MIGKIYVSMVEFYDVRNQKTSIKARPVSILSDMRNNDFTVLPISTINKPQNIDIEYDIELNPQIYQKINLNKVSYIRTHKRVYLHQANIDKTKILGDIKNDYPDLFLKILEKMEKFNKEILENILD
ncbi:hypothetical protein [Fusobacterium polymorphum]|uniref:hypothetical protein n=1 Tax=Fusobacterium nucleatum subsp. polymorphum TaxID=76857 RepID=UPI00300B0F4C